MKLTKSKLKQLIKEVFEEEYSAPNSDPPWKDQMDALMLKAAALYKELPLEGKDLLTQNFEMYFQRWRDEMQDEKTGI